MKIPGVSASNPRSVIQGQPISVLHFGTPISAPTEPGYRYSQGTVLAGINPIPPIDTFGTAASPSTEIGLYTPQPPANPGGVRSTQSNGVANVVTTYNPNSFSLGPVKARTGVGILSTLFG